MARQPAFFIPHGGGPCFFMDDPRGVWKGMEHFLRSLPEHFPERPRAILLVSAHWETEGFALTGAERPGLIYDYHGFPAHTYELEYPVAGASDVASEAAAHLGRAALPARVDHGRGLDHGVFIPLMVALPRADIPVVEMSIDRSLDPALHMAAGAALAPLRDAGVAIIGSGMSFHNMRGYGNPDFTAPANAFDRWLSDAVAMEAAQRADALARWEEAPAARLSHPREEHLLPLMVAAGTARGRGRRIYGEETLRTAISAFEFNDDMEGTDNDLQAA